LLNISTHPGEPQRLFNDDWRQAADFLHRWEFDGFELYPVGDYPCQRIPSGLITGIHLRFFAILAPLWHGDRRRLMKIFGDWQTVEHFYGGRNADVIAEIYCRQLNLAHHLGCAYVVFHPVDCDLDHVYDWRFPWPVEATLDMCAEVINAATAKSRFQGYILFENLWWPGSFRLDTPDEYDYLLSRVNHPHCGIALDTGHLLNKNPALTDERQAVEYLLDCIDQLGETARQIRTVHLTKSLSGPYVQRTQKIRDPYNGASTFWERLDQARRHVGCIDQHEPFESPAVGTVLEKIAPDHVVFEYTFSGMDEWERKISVQKKALSGCLWPQ
jgi:sugar phosphate isomerase/epimerase